MRAPRPGPTARPGRRLRFLVQVVLCVVLLTWAPTIAQAAFSGSASSALVVETYRIPVPTGVSATASCPFLNSTMSVNITGVGPVDRATSYTATLTAQGATTEGREYTLSASRTGTFSVARSLFTRPTMTLRIRAHVNNWVGDPFVATVSC